MRKKLNKKKKSRSLRTLVFYGVIVFSVILTALLIRVFAIVKESKFDGQHQFTLSVGRETQVLAIISFEPITSTLSMLSFSKDQHVSFSSLNREMGIMPDGYIKMRDDLKITGNVSSLLQSLIFHWNNADTNITLYDIFQLWLYTHKIPSSTVYSQKISNLSDTESIDKILALRFTDNALAAENLSIQIVNGSGGSGLGFRLARAISNLGGNVVSVRTASVMEQASKIQYNDPQTHTFQKLKSLLHYQQEKLKNKTIAEIVIIIGKDNTNTKRF